LIKSTEHPHSIENDTNIRLISLFDNEEIGSTSAHGAHSTLLPSTLERIIGSTINGNSPPKNEKVKKKERKRFIMFGIDPFRS
jgi:aspartyl aminopeptidase